MLEHNSSTNVRSSHKLNLANIVMVSEVISSFGPEFYFGFLFGEKFFETKPRSAKVTKILFCIDTFFAVRLRCVTVFTHGCADLSLLLAKVPEPE